MPCTKILVMDQGRIVQQGTPLEIINEEGSKFQSLCKAAGEEEFRHLVSIAEQNKEV
jgi:ABC-type multidrug transport system fused ATPase/permease subunit